MGVVSSADVGGGRIARPNSVGRERGGGGRELAAGLLGWAGVQLTPNGHVYGGERCVCSLRPLCPLRSHCSRLTSTAGLHVGLELCKVLRAHTEARVDNVRADAVRAVREEERGARGGGLGRHGVGLVLMGDCRGLRAIGGVGEMSWMTMR